MNTQLQIFNYNNAPVTFQLGNGDVMANASEMAKPFNKNATHWLRNQSTQEFLKELSALRNRNPIDLVQVVNGGNNSGTWLHEDVALEFARWLSPAFAIWCNDRIKELLKTGVTTVSNDDEVIARAMSVLQNRLEDAQRERQRLAAENDYKQHQLEQSAPKVLFANAVETSNKSCLVGELAKVLKQNGVEIGQNRLFEWLRQNNYLCSKGEAYNQPAQKAMDMKLFEIKKTTINKPDGTILVSTTVKVTGKGQIYFVNKFLNNN